jgi:DNA polymerase III delta prime subunit
MSDGKHEILEDAFKQMRHTRNVLYAARALNYSLEAEYTVLNAKILELEQRLRDVK